MPTSASGNTFLKVGTANSNPQYSQIFAIDVGFNDGQTSVESALINLGQDITSLNNSKVSTTRTINGISLANNIVLDAHNINSDYFGADLDSVLQSLFTSPAFTGTPTAPTAPSSTNNTQIATTAFVKNALYGSFINETSSYVTFESYHVGNTILPVGPTATYTIPISLSTTI